MQLLYLKIRCILIPKCGIFEIWQHVIRVIIPHHYASQEQFNNTYQDQTHIIFYHNSHHMTQLASSAFYAFHSTLWASTNLQYNIKHYEHPEASQTTWSNQHIVPTLQYKIKHYEHPGASQTTWSNQHNLPTLQYNIKHYEHPGAS